MKIIIDARFFGTETGIGRYIKEVVENIETIDRNNEYIIFLTEKNWDLYNPVSSNFSKKQVNIKWYSLEEQLKLGRIIDREKADLCHFPHFNIPVFCKTPFVVTIHDLILRHFPTSRASTLGPIKFYLKYFFYNLVLRNAVKKAKKIITPTFYVRNDVIREFKIDPDKIRVIGEALSDLPRNADLGKNHLKEKGISSPYILYVGNAYPHKNLSILAKAFLELKKDIADLQLVFVGKRDYFSIQLEEELSACKPFKESYPKDIIFYGYANEEELVTLYKHARLYVFPSLMEGFGLPPLEAISFNLQVVCSDIPVLQEVLGGAAIYFNPKEKENIKKVLKQTLNNNIDQIKLIEEGSKMLKRFDWQKTAYTTLEVYEKAGKNGL